MTRGRMQHGGGMLTQSYDDWSASAPSRRSGTGSVNRNERAPRGYLIDLIREQGGIVASRKSLEVGDNVIGDDCG